MLTAPPQAHRNKTMRSQTVRIGTRASPLALAQAHEVRDRLMAVADLNGADCEIVAMSTQADRITSRPLTDIGGKGLFTEEIEAGLLDGRIDMAVHSSKDVPTELPGEFQLSAFLPRADVRDVFIGRDTGRFEDLAAGSVIGTSSPRRQAMAGWLRPDLKVVPLRGNIQTRLAKLQKGEADGTFLAYAGLQRLGMESVATQILDIDPFLPAPGQGAICIETRRDDDRTAGLVAAIDHPPTHRALICERAFLDVLDGSCRTPVAGLAIVSDGRLRFSGMILSFGGDERYRIEAEGASEDALAIGTDAGHDILERAGARFLHEWR